MEEEKIINLDTLTYYDENIKDYIDNKNDKVAQNAASGIYGLKEEQERIKQRLDNMTHDEPISIEELNNILQ